MLPLLPLGFPWSVAYYFATFFAVGEDSTTHPLWLGVAAMLNVAIAWVWAHRKSRAGSNRVGG